MEYSFDVEHAKKYGLREAVILKNLMYWIVKNKANDKHNHDGRTWTYNSIKAFETLFPFLTGKQIRTALDNLVASGVVIKGNYNATAYDRTCWFALADESLLPISQDHLPKKANEVAQKGEPIPDNKPYSKPDEKTDTKPVRPLLSDKEIALTLSKKLYECVPGAKKVDLDDWAEECMWARVKDGIGPAEMLKAWHLAQTDDWLSKRVLSPAAIRRHYNVIMALKPKETEIGDSF